MSEADGVWESKNYSLMKVIWILRAIEGKKRKKERTEIESGEKSLSI